MYITCAPACDAMQCHRSLCSPRQLNTPTLAPGAANARFANPLRTARGLRSGVRPNFPDPRSAPARSADGLFADARCRGAAPPHAPEPSHRAAAAAHSVRPGQPPLPRSRPRSAPPPAATRAWAARGTARRAGRGARRPLRCAPGRDARARAPAVRRTIPGPARGRARTSGRHRRASLAGAALPRARFGRRNGIGFIVPVARAVRTPCVGADA
jgi:hypothetical protein